MAPLSACVSSRAATASELQQGYASQAGAAALPAGGQTFFTQTHGHAWSCSSCHGALPTQQGRHATTGKSIAALAPAFSAERLTDPAKVEEWFRRNCQDVTGRECTAAEMADVLAWLPTLKTRMEATMRHAALLLSTVLACAAWPVHADSPGSRVPLLTAYVQECGACHTPYAPGLLPVASWQRLMADLPRHFGTDASLDKATGQQRSTWLPGNAGGGKRGREEPPQDRIIRAAWFTREHRQFNAAAWQRPSVKSPSNCGACHTQATQGRFSEHEVRVPQ